MDFCYGRLSGFQCCGSMTFWGGSGSADPCLWLMDPDSDPDPAIFVIDLQDASKKLIFQHNFFAYYFLKVHLYIIFQRFFLLFFHDDRRSRIRVGSGSIPLTSGSGSRRPKNMWIRWIRIRIHNTAGVESRHLSKYKMGDISKGVATKKIYKKSLWTLFNKHIVSDHLTFRKVVWSKGRLIPVQYSTAFSNLYRVPYPLQAACFLQLEWNSKKVRRESRLQILRSTKKFRIHNLHLKMDWNRIRQKYPIN